jgi:ubiquinone/menaquinone biosynthesis C-methylase UbiE
MSTKVEIGIKSQQEWDEKWLDIFDHYQQDLRHAYYINAILNPNEKKLLEIAAGSFRDTGALNKWGLECYGADFSIKSVEMAKKQFPDLAEKMSQQDAFEFSFKDKEFDLSFSNGFFGYFNDNEILKLAKEQARITKYRIAATVHNAHNKQFVEYFDKLKQNDPLYKVRFFEMDEIAQLMKSVAKNVEIIPVGKGKKYYEDDLINIGLGEAKYIRKSFDYHKLNLLETSERLMCIGEL